MLNDGPQRCLHPDPWNLYVTLPGKNDLGCVIKLMIWRWRDYPGLFRWVQCNDKGPHKREAGG